MAREDSWFLVRLLVVAVLGGSTPCLAAERDPSYPRLTVVKAKEGDALTVRAPEEGRVRRFREAERAIEWGLAHTRTMVVSEGRYGLTGRVEIPRPRVTLIIGKDATLRVADDADLADWPVLEGAQDDLFRQLLYNRGHDGVRIVNVGLLVAPPVSRDKPRHNSSAAIWFDGCQGGGSGIDGGLVYSPGAIEGEGYGHAVAIHDAERVRVPFVYGKSIDQAVLWLEGCRRCSVGTVVNLAAATEEGETVDMNAWNEHVVIDTVVGVGPRPGADQVLDVNASPDNLVNQVVGVRGTKNMVSVSSGAGMRFSERAASPDSKGTRVGPLVTIDEVQTMRKTNRWPSIPEDLPRLTVTAKFVVVDGQGRKHEYGGTHHVTTER